ncbi:cellulose synthase-like protein E6 [Pistacia vera]|uniref:cellulose synthase-like protein E6 n=1 Tax=Pistacia vera TaxID=55513 RepID=UPI0012633465|nr:cellulose synthase-like protein E6 [Pistacia vera]XP_031259714.1 cellulose synthase-like protein E6 [Pistacia vera]
MAELQPLFETKQAKGRAAFKVFTATVFAGICLMLVYRFLHIPRGGEEGRLTWIGMFIAEVLFSFYWIITQSARWNVTHNFPFIRRLSQRYEDKLPGVDVFVCTADPIMEPPTLVINTVLSVMSFNYPPEKLSVYLSDDGGSEFTFYALLEASHFSKFWIPFCKKFKVAPMSPEAYFSQQPDEKNVIQVEEWLAIKKKYEDMKHRIESIMAKGSISEEVRSQHKGFSEWYNSEVTKQNHQSIVQIIIDGKDTNAVDKEDGRLPTLVYMAREKRPGWPHNFKAGAMNALIRVSSEISNGTIILNVDCDMYANNPDAVREALCFFMDEMRGPEIAFMQHPQRYNNITKNDLYSNCGHAVHQVELAGIGGYDAALYCGTACFHRRESLSGAKYSKDYREHKNSEAKETDERRNVDELEKTSKILASCSYEKDTAWGKEMGLLYGCPVEDVVTGLAVQCRGWKSMYYDPHRRAFIGVAPNTLDIHLVQFKRWSEGLFQIFFSKYCPFIYGHGKIKLGAQMGYCVYLLWAPVSLPTFYYIIVPPLCLLHSISLFPKVSSPWFIPFAYVFIARNVYSIIEALNCDSTLKGWWNLQRMLVIRRTTSFFFAFVDVILKQLGLSQTAFALTAKVVTEDVLKRYDQEVMEFGSSSLMFTIIATLAMLNLFSLVSAIFKMIFQDFGALEKLVFQVILCGLTVLLNIPIYEALFIRKDKGSLPFSVMFKSIAIASLACLIPLN